MVRVSAAALRALECAAGAGTRSSTSRRSGVSDARVYPVPRRWPLVSVGKVKPSTISTAWLHPSPGFHVPPIKQVVSLRSYPVNPVGNLISRKASHLDAFSAYPHRT